MSKKVFYDWNDVEGMVQEILRQLQVNNWKPDYVVGLTRGGLLPAVLVSQYLNIPMHALKVSLRDGQDTESNTWMASDAFGYIPTEERLPSGTRYDPTYQRKILIIDDINDTGATIEWIKKDWPSGCLPDNPHWQRIWGNNVRFAVLVNNDASATTVDYSAKSINKTEVNQWLVFPWEEWWYV